MTQSVVVVQEKTEGDGGWKEYTAPDGRKYYYNKTTKESRWTMPDEMKAGAEAGGECLPPTASALRLSARLIRFSSNCPTPVNCLKGGSLLTLQQLLLILLDHKSLVL